VELAERLSGDGARVLVFGGPEERGRTARVAASSGAWDLGGRTDLRALAGGLAACDLVVANDTGPMHLAAALDRPLVVPWGAGDPVQTRPLSTGARVLARPELPCHPCLEQECPRRGPGTLSPEARRECLTLLETREVEAEVRDALTEGERVERPIVPGDAPGVGTGEPDTRRTGEAADE
jgi:ADP-heptose:LPS heptosyltransferase